MSQTPLRLLYVQPCTNFGGAERQASTSAPRLARFGFDVTPLVGPGGAIIDWLRENGVTDIIHIDSFPGNWPKPRGLSRLGLPSRYYRCLQQVSAAIRQAAVERRTQIIYAAMPFSWVAATPVARELGIPIVWRAGGCEASVAAKLALRAWTLRNAPDLLVCCGEKVQETFGPLVHAPSVVVHNGVDTQMFFPHAGDAGRYRPPGAKVVVGFAARLVEQKRPDDVIKMAARIAPDHPEVAFLVAGEGSRRPEYESLAHSLGVAHAVTFLGYVADMRAFYAACDIIVLPSRSEGCPNVVLESMAMRRAVVVSDAAGTQEVVAHEREGLIFPVSDITAFAASVRRLVEDPVLRAALMNQGYFRVTSAFNARTRARRLANVLRRSVARSVEPIG
ncbi:MAG TPA: glycosyltransferase family 4 protein, partial [Polyangia bacterium]|nr:glycosyltransferase family 4 protein [Polyangia bacterium]